MESELPEPEIWEPPRTHNWRVPPALNQGTQPSCVGHGWRHEMEASPIMVRRGASISAPDLYREAKKVDEWPGENYSGTSVRAGAKVLQALGHIERYVWANTVDTIRDFVLLRGPVVMGTVWTDAMFRPDSAGFVIPQGAAAGGHCWLIFGFDAEKQAFHALNSWGTGWGLKGAFWVRETDLATLLSRGGEACAPTERLVAP